jgi:uncharacterized protein (DUF2126 family)
LSATLHPTVPVHAPLVFELIDSWRQRSIGQCTYYVGSPDGHPYPARPANASEAEERRKERFQVNAPSPNTTTLPEAETNPVFPMTLDLRLPKTAHNTEWKAQN